MPNETDDPWLSTGDVAKQLGLTRSTARRLIRDQGLPHLAVGKGGHLRVRQSTLDAYLEAAQR